MAVLHTAVLLYNTVTEGNTNPHTAATITQQPLYSPFSLWEKDRMRVMLGFHPSLIPHSFLSQGKREKILPTTYQSYQMMSNDIKQQGLPQR